MRGLWTLLLCGTLVWTVAAVNSPEGRPAVPKRMKQLYRQYKKLRLGSQDSNTVRYIAPVTASPDTSGQLLYSLDGIHKQNETVVRAELYVNIRQSGHQTRVQVDISEVSPYYIYKVQRATLDANVSGWQQINVTDTVLQCTNTIKTNNQLAVGFSNVSANATSFSLHVTPLLRHHGLPFLLVYSNSSRTLEMDQTDVEPAHENINQRGSAEGNWHRKRRAVSDNRIEFGSTRESIPIDEDIFNELTNKVEAYRAFGKGKYGKSKTETRFGEETRTQLADTQEDGDVEFIPWPSSGMSEKKRRRKEKLLLDLISFQQLEQRGCRRKSLRVNFNSMSWGDRIIEPKKFDAYYCEGECSFQHSTAKHLTNHATLQSLISSTQKRKIPSPCCIPRELSPVTLMFYDKYGNIVIKTYPDMSVELCACQ